MDRGGLRLKLFKAQAKAGDIVLLFADESEALTHPYLARAWAKKGADLRVPAPGQAQKIAMMGSLDYARRKLIVTTSRTKRSTDFIAHLQALDRPYGPQTRGADEAGGPCPRQRSHSPQQGEPGGAGRARPLAQRRMVAQIRSGVERHRNRLGRPESAPPCASNLHRPRQPRDRHPPRRRRLEFRPKSRSVG